MAVLPLQLARVSNLLRTSTTSSAISRAQAQLLRVQNELSTGLRVNQPSDDPGAAAGIQQIQKMLERRDAYAANLRAASDHLGAVDSTLGDVSQLLQQAQDVASA